MYLKSCFNFETIFQPSFTILYFCLAESYLLHILLIYSYLSLFLAIQGLQIALCFEIYFQIQKQVRFLIFNIFEINYILFQPF